MSTIIKGQQKKNSQAPSSTNGSSTSSAQNASGTSSRTVKTSSSSPAKRGDVKESSKPSRTVTASSSSPAKRDDVNESSKPSRTKAASSSNSAGGGDNNSDRGNDRGNDRSHHGSKDSSSQTSKKDGKKPELKRSSTKDLLAKLTLSRSDQELIKKYKHLELKHLELERKRPDRMEWVRASMQVDLWEGTYKEEKREYDQFELEKPRNVEEIILKKRKLQYSERKLDAAWDTYDKVKNEDGQIVKQQEPILEQMPDKHPYKIWFLKQIEMEKASNEKHKKRAEKREKEAKEKKDAEWRRKERAQRLDEKAEKERYPREVGNSKPPQASGSQW
ncbi:predicted protein [Sclerotinia sclerotiorum 1980 UF-70]|uniref:Uncharacterized protein n=2 Tax=Sclerotinia sclerotiorum (strain ATCC 18683 / 1980 / Ss-1) TaxID=665079 RepID=A7E738_SCLS1|nr:predicted protein [Sclerotinia sclerotiorum 1980 UF-70]APA06359.1 hypothetical protein sscle_01g011290 [Sclerotinia sclerotiorum 1980 UF-70]EDN96190.1 predicted protein [Sclerotinia sclerotiorum 1980 UF-70]